MIRKSLSSSENELKYGGFMKDNTDEEIKEIIKEALIEQEIEKRRDETFEQIFDKLKTNGYFDHE